MAVEGTLFVVSGPSCAGKHTILRPVLARDSGIEYAVSATTRPPRPGEVNGKDYFFLSEAAFRRRVAAGDFVEWAQVHGRLYGTLHEELDRHLRTGKDLVLELDVQGMRNVKAERPDVVTVFVMAPSLEELERRLRRRGADDEAAIALRLRNARRELAARKEYDYVIVNDVIEEAVEKMLAIIREQRLATKTRGCNPLSRGGAADV